MTRVLAIVVAFNEADVLDASLRALVEQGCDAVVVDDGSSDGTAEIAESWLGRGVVAVERRRDSGRMVWADLLRRRAEIVREHDYDWYALNDADEFRESPWPGLTFAEGLAKAERMGFNAVNFRVLNFRPTGAGFEPGDDPRERLTHFEPAEACDAPQVKAFKRPASGELDLLRSGGHDIRFDGRRVCPIPFILRHYPIRSPEHGRRKVLGERLPRFAAEERANGWHVQYDDLVASGAEFTWQADELVAWDADRVRAELLAEAADALVSAVQTRGVDLAVPQFDHAALRRWIQDRDGIEVSAAAHRRAFSLFERLMAGEDAATVAMSDPAAAPLVLRQLDALFDQLDVAGQVSELAAGHALREAFAAALAPDPLAGARAFVTVVDADEALAAPDLVAAFGAAFDAASDATLVFCAPGWDAERLEADLGGLVARLGLDGPFSPDLLAVAEPLPSLAARAGAVLSALPPAGGLTHVPHLGADGAAALKELAAC